jgi:hypothetical protein
MPNSTATAEVAVTALPQHQCIVEKPKDQERLL